MLDPKLLRSDLERFPLSPGTIAHLCHRRLGIGADGLIVVAPDPGGADFRIAVTHRADKHRVRRAAVARGSRRLHLGQHRRRGTGSARSRFRQRRDPVAL